ncbi:ABC transporter ATP-binding protein [Clostridium chauvoei]|uniref:ATP-binding cassette domain-containing protein n=2 Tax=Clostridium chauvoei TaxID=46867 RepID=A0ABD4RKR0_9CLOT|nr:ATP-binding cassette domain-containing protein [Clostridium chauvoei]ATD53794.1 ABC transporter [Clostridium chauvoei]ATD58398.1 ABC transporter [Clostridium chauvoei]MBX7281749.1 ATP-binding cassette domain-containing protein [Clostridium chauvoei]MBX7284278.1 ATP-binding cassette domain-containing protein [Clostridium chauvoei]MBX7286773.1 ATP-binding cassette domain-containing protein [Clostridium chauvoei]
MLQLKNVTKNFKKTTVVDNISFDVNEGEIVGLLGENGAGKTTTLRMVSTMLQISNGEITVNGIDVKKNPEKVRKEIGILFGGDVGLYDRLTGRENIRYFANLYGMSKLEANKRIDDLAKSFGMEDYIDKPVGKYSRGMKQKISISRSIVHNPSVMLFDEPTTGLDVSAARIVQSFILQCKKENKVILFSSHSMKEVEKLCDRVVIINKGNLLENSTIEHLKEKHNNNDLEEVFLNLIGGHTNE